MKKKILISTVLVIMILSMSLMLFAGCKDKLADLNKNFAIPTAHVGATSMELGSDDVDGGIKPINKNMSGFEMLSVAMENFYNANYAVTEYNGGVNMKLAGAIKVNQVVQSTKIRDGKGDATGNNANGATYFADNKSHSSFAKIYEKFVIKPNSWQRKAASKGDISYSKPSKSSGRLGKWKPTSSSKFGKAKNYNSLQELVDANCNNPTILWMYELKEEYITDQFAPVYNEKEKCYKFAFKFDKDKATVEYRKVMQVQLETNAGMKIEGLTFEQLMLEVVVWENGMLRAINVNEVYHMKMQLTKQVKLNSNVNLKATQLFSFDPNEAGYKINDHLKAF